MFFVFILSQQQMPYWVCVKVTVCTAGFMQGKNSSKRTRMVTHPGACDAERYLTTSRHYCRLGIVQYCSLSIVFYWYVSYMCNAYARRAVVLLYCSRQRYTIFYSRVWVWPGEKETRVVCHKRSAQKTKCLQRIWNQNVVYIIVIL